LAQRARFYSALVSLGAASWCLGFSGIATAQPRANETPPSPPADESAPSRPPLETDPLARRHVRGCPVELAEREGSDSVACRRARLEGLREFEARTFPKPAERGSPWMKAGSRSRRDAAPASRRTSELRPDLPWLDAIAMPDLPVRWHQRIIEYLEFYKGDDRGRNIMAAWLRDQGKYRRLILSHLRKAGLPEDLLYVCMIESSYDPREVSRAGASGLWQFMPKGGRVYGLRIDHWVDERNDPVRSTEAAMLYWADLYQRFGNWDLAMAAYNAGYAGVLRAVAKYNTNDYWRLIAYENALPWGTSLYVAKALAAAIVGRNRKLFGYDHIQDAAALEWDTVTVPKSVTLKTVARAAGVEPSDVEDLNPHLRKKRTPPRAKDYPVRVPRGTGRLFRERFPHLRSEWDAHDVYVASHGERFEDIATMHGISRASLRRLNGIEHDSEVRGGLALLVPRLSAAEKKRNLARARQDLYASGHPKGRPGERLVVAIPDKNLRPKGKKRVFYRVVSGDTQYGVARAFGVNRLQLARWNELDPEAFLQARMVLVVFVDPKLDLESRRIKVLDERHLIVVDRGSEEHLAAAEARMGRERIVYRAKSRESFAHIAKRFGLSDFDLARINRRPRSTMVEKGEEIVVYRVVDARRSKRAAEQARKLRRRAARKAGKKAKKTAKAKTAAKAKPKTKEQPKAKTTADSEAKTRTRPAPEAKPARDAEHSGSDSAGGEKPAKRAESARAPTPAASPPARQHTTDERGH
jgi:membrane-bound lytic murein transglycosylase D